MKCTVTLEQITQDRIVLGVKHPAWAQELMMFAPMIKDRVNKLFDHERIKKIHFRVISQPRAKNNRSFFSQQPQTSYNPTLSTRELQSIEAIKDKELALSCKEFLIRCKKVKGSSS